MKIPTIVIACAVIALTTVLVGEFLWNLGTAYWVLLGALAVAQLGATIHAFRAQLGMPWVRPTVVVLLLIGQWWLIKMLAAQAAWLLRDFAP